MIYKPMNLTVSLGLHFFSTKASVHIKVKYKRQKIEIDVKNSERKKKERFHSVLLKTIESKHDRADRV